MSYNIKGEVEVARYATSKAKNLMTSVGENISNEQGTLELDTYTQSEMDDIFSVIPLSKYGTADYLPAGVAGSFEGATSNASFRYRSLILEDNGDLVMLRNGTNASTRNVFYSYMSNALTTDDMSTFINTNRTYNPSYFNGEYFAINTISTDHNVVMGVCQHTSTGNRKWFISATNNTMDDTVHNGCLFNLTDFPVSPTFAMMGKTTCYIFGTYNVSNRLKLYVYSVPKSTLLSNSTSPVLTTISGWSTTSFYGEVFSGADSDAIVINNVQSSKVAGDKPYMLIPTSASQWFAFGGGGVGIFAAEDPNNQNILRIRIEGDAYCADINKSTRPKHSYSYTANMISKTATLDAGNTAPLLITDNGSSYSVSGGTFRTGDTVYSGFSNTSFSYCTLENGVSFAYTTGNTASDTNYVFRYKISNNPTSVFDALNVNLHNSSTNVLRGQWRPSYASAVGSNLTSIELLPNNYCKLLSTDSSSSFKVVVSKYLPPDTYVYKSVNLGPMTGYAPSSDRKFIDNVMDHRLYISYISQSGTVSTSSSILTEYKLSGPISIGSDGLAINTNRVSISSLLLTSFKNLQLSGVSGLESSLGSRISLYIPQQTGVPVFAIIQAVTTSRGGFFKVVEVNTNTRTSEITSLSLSRVVYQSSTSEVFSNINSSIGTLPVNGYGITIYEGTDFYFIGGNFAYQTAYVGNAGSMNFRAKVLKSSGNMSNFTTMGQWSPYMAAQSQPSAIPGLGFGVYNGSLQQSEAYTRSIFSSYGTTSADYDAWTVKSNQDPKILVSQDVPEAFIVYFTQTTPVLLNGKKFMLPITSIDLTTIKSNPANSTFHIYVILIEGVAQYFITETPLAETGAGSYDLLWIGTVTTNSLQIDSINVEKRSRLDIFGASLTAKGSSFPVSYGMPSQSGTIDW